MREIKTGRLHIRNFVPEDWKSLQQLMIWYMSSPFAFYDHQWPVSDDEIINICQWFASSDDFLAVCLHEDHRFIGYISLNPTADINVCNLGYCFNAPYHGQGYAFESCKALIDYAFRDLGVEKIITGTAAENIPSCKLLGKLGMKMIESAAVSFHNDEFGSPIEFLGREYALTAGGSQI